MPSPTFITMTNEPTGALKSAGLTDQLVANAGYLWGCGARVYDMFTGAIYSGNSNVSDGEITVWRGYFTYAGVKNLLTSITRTAGRVRVYVTSDNFFTGTLVYNSNSSQPGTAIDITNNLTPTALTFTNGTQYSVWVTYDREGGSSAAGQVNYIAIETDYATVDTGSPLSFPTLVALADSDTPTSTNFNTVVTALQYDNYLAKVPTGQGVYATGTGSVGVAVGGAFFFRGRDASTTQITINITYRKSDGAATLNIRGGTPSPESFSLSASTTEQTDTFNLANTYTINNFYTWDVTSPVGYLTVLYITISKTLAMTNTLSNPAHGDEVRGSTGTNPLAKLGGSGSTSQVNEIRTILHGSSAVTGGTSANYGFQFLSPINYTAVTLGNGGIYYLGAIDGVGVYCKRPHVWRYLYWMPTTSGASGTITYGANKTISLTDTNAGGWNFVDLDLTPDLTQGMTYTISGSVYCAFEQQS